MITKLKFPQQNERKWCKFCRIISSNNDSGDNQILAKKETVAIFDDIRPAAPNHLLVIPCAHTESILNLTACDLGKGFFLFFKPNSGYKSHQTLFLLVATIKIFV